MFNVLRMFSHFNNVIVKLNPFITFLATFHNFRIRGGDGNQTAESREEIIQTS